MMVLWNQDYTQLLHCIPVATGCLGPDLATPWKSRLCSHHLLIGIMWPMLGITLSALVIVDLWGRVGTTPSLKCRSKATEHALRLNKRGLGNIRNVISLLLSPSLWARCQRNRRNWLMNTVKPPGQKFPLQRTGSTACWKRHWSDTLKDLKTPKLDKVATRGGQSCRWSKPIA